MRLFRVSGGPKRDREARELSETLARYTLFEGLSEPQLQRLVPALRVKEFRDEEIVCHCPDATHDVFVVLEGKVALARKLGEDLYPLEIEGTGGIVNAPMLVDLASIYVGARALGPVRLLAIDSEALRMAAEEDPAAGLVLVRNLYRLSLRQLERVIDRLLIG